MHALLFDECDREIIEAHGWYASKSGHTTYARSLKTKEYLHRIILRAPRGIDVDHRNGNGLDLRRDNLRAATRTQNNMNRRSQRGGRKGIYLDASTGRWRSEITAAGHKHRSPRFNTEAEAISWREAMEKSLFGEFAGDGTSTL